MQIKNIKRAGFIISECYMEDGDFLEDLWFDVYNANLDFTLQETFEALVVILRFMVDHEIIELFHFDHATKKTLVWPRENGERDALHDLREYLATMTEKKVKKNPFFLHMFKYPTYRWKVPYPLDKKKYGLDQLP